MTITPEANAVKPLPCALPDPEDAFTIEQLRECLIEMEAQLASYPVNLSRGPGWVRQQILAMLDRGIVDPSVRVLQGMLERDQLCAEKTYDDLKRQRDELLKVLRRLSEKTHRANAIRHSGGRLDSGDWCELYDITNDARALLSRIESEAKP